MQKPIREVSVMKKEFRVIRIVRWVLVIFIIVAFIVTIGARIYFRSSLGDYYSASVKSFVIPQINEGFIPQGITYDEKSGLFFIAGYSKDDASPIYLVDEKGNTKGHIQLANNDGSTFDNHAGGIAINGDYVYLAGCDDCCLYVFDYDDILNASEDESIRSEGMVSFRSDDDDYLRADSVTVNSQGVYVAEFYRYDNYLTADSHIITTADGTENKALIARFPFDDSELTTFGIGSEPDLAISAPDLVQGIHVDGDKIYLSESYGASKSSVEVFNIEKGNLGRTIDVLGKTVKLIELDTKSRISKKALPPMSEEIVIKDGRLYTMCESASNKYIFGKLTSGEYCYATDLNYFEK